MSPMTLTPGLTKTNEGVSVRWVSADCFPIPKTFTEVPMVWYFGLVPNGCSPQARRQLAIELSGSSAEAISAAIGDEKITRHITSSFGRFMVLTFVIPNQMDQSKTSTLQR